MIIVVHCTLLYHLTMLLLLQRQCSMNTQLEFTIMMINLSHIICEEDNTHTCNPFLHQAVL